MDPKQQTLDPKLKEVYDRVMGMSLPQTPTQSGQTPPVPTTQPPVVTPSPIISKPADPIEMQAGQTTSAPSSIPVLSTPPPSTAPKQNVPSHNPESKTEKVTIGYQSADVAKSKKIPAVVYILGAVVFFAIYAVFWIKVFNVPVPFLPF